MQRPVRQSSSNTGRRNYHRNSNCFKFHNFVFNEDNQSFCLEEQHGNKKITVMHWKKPDERVNEEQKAESGNNMGNNSTNTTTTESSSPAVVRQLSKVSSDMSNQNKRRSTSSSSEVTTSATFPPPMVKHADVSACAGQWQMMQQLWPFNSSHQNFFSPPYELSSSRRRMFDVHFGKEPTLVPINNGKTTQSSSSMLASGSSLSSYGSHYASLQSLTDLDLSSKGSGTKQRKLVQMQQLQLDVDSDNENENFLDETDDDSDIEIDTDMKNLSSFQTYRSHFSEHDLQSQPLDLSIKANRDQNNNNNDHQKWSTNSMIDLKKQIKKEEDESGNMFGSIDSLNSFGSKLALKSNEISNWMCHHWKDNENTGNERDIGCMRSDADSPSALISAIKCCSPSSPHHSTFVPTHLETSSLNPFSFFNKMPLSTSNHLLSSSSDDSICTQQAAQNNVHNDIRSKHLIHLTTADMFDALIEEELYKMFQHPNSSNVPPVMPSSESEELEQRIENKLRLLQNEILSQKKSINANLNGPNQEHLKLHFKLDSNRNLEPYSGSECRRTLSESSLQSPPPQQKLQPLMMSKSRPNAARNQIKRQLEDAFKQNGFLVKTKQVSDANNMAMFCKFRQLRKYTRYYLKSWQNHLPDEVNKLWKGFLPPKTERSLFLPLSNSSNTLVSSDSEPPSSSMDLL